MWGTLFTALIASSGGALTTATIIRVVAPPEETAAVFQSVERGASTALAWFVDLEPPADRKAADDALRACGEDNGCVTVRLQQLGIDRGVYVVANLSLRPPLVTVEVLDAMTGGTLAGTLAEPSSAGVEAAIEQAVQSALEQAGHTVGGRLDIAAVPGDAALTLRDDTGSVFRSDALLLPGNYRLGATREGFEDAELRLEVVPRAAQAVRVQLVEAAPLWTRWWLWTAVGVAVGAGIVTVIATHGGSPVEVCHPVGGGPC